jgi:hypothetical protein
MNIEKLSFAEMKKRIKEHLQMALNIEDFSINFAKQDGDVWKVRNAYHSIIYFRCSDRGSKGI